MTRAHEVAFGFGRYLVLAGCFLGLAAGYSSTYFYSSGLFLLPVAKDFGLSRGQASLGPLVCTLAAAAMIPLFGRLLDRIGAIPVALLSLVGLAVGFALMATFTGGFTSYLVCSVLIAVFGTGSTALPFSRLVVLTFMRRRGLALGVMLTGTGCGAVIVPLLVIPSIQQHGWRATYGFMAAIVLAATVVVAALIMPFAARLSQAARQRSEAQAMSSAPRTTPMAVWGSTRFVLIGGTFFCLATGIISVVVHYVPLLTEAGVSLERAAALAASIGLASIAGRLIIGSLLDMLPAELLALGLLALGLIGMLLLASGQPQFALPGGLLLGVVVGAEVDMIAFFTARFFPSDAYGTAYGGLFALFLIGGAIGPAITGYLYDLAGSYRAPLVLLSALLLVAAHLMWRLRQLNLRHPA